MTHFAASPTWLLREHVAACATNVFRSCCVRHVAANATNVFESCCVRNVAASETNIITSCRVKHVAASATNIIGGCCVRHVAACATNTFSGAVWTLLVPRGQQLWARHGHAAQRKVNRSGLFNLLVLSSFPLFHLQPTLPRTRLRRRSLSYALVRHRKKLAKRMATLRSTRPTAVGCSICGRPLASLGFP